MYQAVIFDLDGTLLDTLDDLADSVNYVLKKREFPERTKDEVRSFVGNGIHKLIERSVPENTADDIVEEVFEEFVPYYRTHCMEKTKPYDGIVELLHSLKLSGIRIAVVSNKADDAVHTLCNVCFANLFDEIVGERSGIARKPAPDSVNEVLRRLVLEPSQAVYIGDSDVDVETAKNAGMKCIAVDWGFRDRECLEAAGATEIVSGTTELLSKLL